MKHMQKFTAAAMAVLLLGFTVVPAFAETAPSAKEEVIYAMADASGKVTDAEAVNIFAGGDIVDYGDYSAVKPLNTNDTITQNGDQIAFSSTADKVYYQGTMKNAALPWNISIRYYLDGKEYAPQDVAGKSGALEIRFSVTKNESCGGSFYDDYALQASFTLDTERCQNIVSNGATVANVGSDKQLTYTILPGKGIDTVITADVTDFEMDAAAINGVRLNLDVDVDDTDLMDKVDELVSAIGDLDDGAWELHDGTEELYDATKTLNSKVGDLHSGVGDLTVGAGDLYTGLTDITAQNQQLTDGAYTAYEGLCTAAAAALNAQLEANGMDAVTLTPSTYSAVLIGLLEKLDADEVYQEAYDTALQQVTQQVNQQADQLYLGYVKSQADSIYLAYVTTQADALYAQVAAQAVREQLIQSGYSEAQADAYLQTADGQTLVAQTVSNMTEEQKVEIREAYIQQMMASDDVTSQINAAVATVSAAKQVSELKGQLDSYGVFYQGLVAYTDAVSSAAAGAKSLKLNMDTLYSNTGKLKLSVGELSDAVGDLYDGTGELTDGTTEFVDKTSDMDTQISDEIDSMTASLSGGDGDAESFVSEKNTNVNTVQFVIKTAAIEKAETTTDNTVESAPLTFWQKLLRLVGLYA